ncbi:uncharacterized protein [Amphiura filiformis]|uniref:uncharacterized protein n=1 Tax=Amphiura filiformis TaxID=82378 RepID=UPI003B21E389
MATLEEVKPDLDKALQYLKMCNDFTTHKVGNALLAIYTAVCEYENRSVQHKKVSYLVSQGFGQLFGKMWSGLSGFLERTKWEEDGFANLELMLNTYFNFTDYCSELAVDLGKLGSIPLLFAGLGKLEKYFEQKEFVTIQGLLQGMLFLLDNSISLCNSNRKIYRDAGAVSIFKRYLKSQNAMVRVVSLTILAYVVDEAESAILATSDGGVAILVQWLHRAVNSSDHSAQIGGIGARAGELLDCLNHLAINDSNKLEIEKQGCIPNIVRMLQDDFDEKDQSVAAEAVWNLAFKESIRTSPQLQKAVPLLDKLRKSANRNLRKISGIAFWEINDNRPEDLPTRESTQQELPPSYEETINEPRQATASTTKVMVSYQWDSQQIAVKIRDDLVNNGFKVWMDLTHMGDDILTSMAEAVEKSEVILMFMSETYKDSQSCRTEAEYAYKKKKKVIPLLVQEGYDPDGWLGAILGTKLYYKFFTEDLMETEMSALLKALTESAQDAKAHDHDDEPDGPIIATQETNFHAAAPSPNSTSPVSPSSKSPVSNWTAKDVQDWLKRENLGNQQSCCLSIKRNKQNLCNTLHGLDGAHLEEMYQEYSSNANKFKDEMRSDYQMNGKVCLKFTVALKKLFQK